MRAVEQLANIGGSLPLVLGIALFIGIVVLVRLLLSPNGMERRRRSRLDRRGGQAMPPLPFYDSERRLVTEDRRTHAERRKRAFMIITTQRRA